MWVLMKAPNGKRLLLNLSLTGAIGEDDAGNAVAMFTGGGTTETGETFDFVVNELMAEEEPPKGTG